MSGSGVALSSPAPCPGTAAGAMSTRPPGNSREAEGAVRPILPLVPGPGAVGGSGCNPLSPLPLAHGEPS